LTNANERRNVLTTMIENLPADVLIAIDGSDISLISESFLKNLNCKRIPTYRSMRGLDSQEIESTYHITTVIKFPEISFEADLFVVPADCINASVLLGTDVLSQKGVTYVRTGNVQRLMRDSVSQVCHLRIVDTSVLKTSLLGDDRDRLIALINDFSEFFVIGTATSTVNTGSIEIKLKSDVPVHYRPYKLSVDEKLRVRGIVDDLLSKGIIRESKSEYASPVILVKKKDGSDRMCVDYCALNSITVKERFPLPLIDDHIDKLGNSKFFTSLDMATGFLQIPIKDDDSISKTAFVTPETFRIFKNALWFIKCTCGLSKNNF
jgi:hypothetical protein